MNANGQLLEALSRSEIFQTYERAYTEATGMPVTLRPVETWQLPLHGKRRENPFCALMAQTSRTCAACLQMQEKLAQSAADGPCTMTCAYGLRETAVPVSRMGHARIASLFPSDLLDRAGAVTVAGHVPFPPLSRMGLPELAAFEAMPIAGVTYGDLFFVRRGHLSESLCCHELVHVVQWDRLGVDRFLLVYGMGLIQSGYRESPLEAMAYQLQADFDRGALSADAVKRIQKETDAVWMAVQPHIESIS